MIAHTPVAILTRSRSDPDQLGQVGEVCREPVDDDEQLEHLEVARRRLTVRAALGRKLTIEVGKELWPGSNLEPVAIQLGWDSDSAISCSTRLRVRARSSGGASSRFVTMLASKTARRSAGVICSRSSAVTILDATGSTIVT